MRAIKFRYWNVFDKEMHIMESLYFFEEEGIHAISDGSVRGSYCDYKIMQYTGLTDKDGVEIYEGDILSDGHFVSKVEFSVDRYCSIPISWKDGYMNLNLWLLKRNKAGCPVSVVGNIYENPELLEPEK